MKVIDLLAAINAITWGSLAFLGSSLVRGVASQHVAGYPASGQIGYYIYIPCAVGVSAIALWLLGRRGMLRRTVLGIELCTLVAVAPYVLFFTGGI